MKRRTLRKMNGVVGNESDKSETDEAEIGPLINEELEL